MRKCRQMFEIIECGTNHREHTNRLYISGMPSPINEQTSFGYESLLFIKIKIKYFIYDTKLHPYKKSFLYIRGFDLF